MHHLTEPRWLLTDTGQPRGYIQPQCLRELWFHTGTVCNLRCPFCLEGSGPGDNRLQAPSVADVEPFIQEALKLGVEQFSFTGGEPFVNRDLLAILAAVLPERPALVLTNGTEPLHNRFGDLLPLADAAHPLRLRVSLDWPDPTRHDAGRGPGSFELAVEALRRLHDAGFGVSVARQAEPQENVAAVEGAFRTILRRAGLPEDLPIVSFPDFLPPGATADVPTITETCMTTFKDAASRADFMCHYSKMVVKQAGRMRVYACTLVDDDPDYDLGGTLAEAMPVRVMLKHHRCYDCFARGASCSEPDSAGESASDSSAA